MAKEKVKKPFYKKWWVWVLAVIIIGSIATGGGEDSAEPANADPASEVKADDSTKKDAGKKEKKEEPKTAGIGETATVADVGFTVEAAEETNEIDSGNEFVENAKTDGKFVILDVKIDNGKKEALTINSSFFKIKAGDVEYEPNTDGKVMMAMGDDMGDFFLEQINPGLSKSGKVVFELPADVDLSKKLLHCQTGAFGIRLLPSNIMTS